MRGLKLNLKTAITRNKVAPYVGAWIETSNDIENILKRGSHPTWVRGLKHPVLVRLIYKVSRTLRGCVD